VNQVFKIEKSGSYGCPDNQYPLLVDEECVGCFEYPKEAAAKARDLGANSIDAFDYTMPESESSRHALALKPDGTWCHTFSNMA
jgi:hypothetical protein